MMQSKATCKMNWPITVVLVLSFTVVVFVVIMLFRIQGDKKDIAKKEIIEGINVLFPQEEISALYYDSNVLWAGGRDGVYFIDSKADLRVSAVFNDIRMTYNASFCHSRDGSLWIGHEDGITVIKDGMRIDYSSPQIPGGRVNTIMCDTEGGVWAGIQGGAVHFSWRNNSFVIDKTLTASSGLSEDTVNAISEDAQNGIWFGSYLAKKSGGISILRDGKWQYISTEQGLPHQYINAILPIGGKYMLVGTGHLDRGGLALFEVDGENIDLKACYTVENGLPGEKIRYLFLDSKGYLWITTESDGILICPSYRELFQQELRGVYLTTKNGLSDNEVKTIIEAEGYYWLGGRHGLTRIASSVIDKLIQDEIGSVDPKVKDLKLN